MIRPTDNTTSLVSLSAYVDKSGIDVVADAMLQVRMNPTEYQQFNDTYYPTRTASGSRKITRLDYANLTEFITINAAAVTSVYSFLRMLLARGDVIDAMNTEIDQYQYIHTYSQTYMLKDEELKEYRKALTSETKKFVTNAASGTHHILVPEGKGYKIVFVGSPETRSNISPDVGREHFIQFEPLSSDSTLQIQTFAKYKTKLSDKVLSVISKINSLLGISADKDLALSRQMVDIQISNAFFPRIDAILKDANFVPKGSQGFFSEISPLPTRIIEGIGEISKIVLVIDPCKPVASAINARSRLLLGSQDSADMPVPKPINIDDIISDEAFIANPNISFSFSVSLPENVCRYVTQTPENKEISLFLLHTWVRTWAPSYIRQSGSGKVKKRATIARYVMSPSSIADITKLREDNGYHIEEGKVDNEGIYVSDKGTLRYAPKASEISFESTKKYEADMEAYVKASFDVGSPIDMNTHKAIVSNVLLSNRNSPADDEKRLKQLKDTVREYSGELIAQNWDYSTLISVSDNGARMEPTSLENVNQPDSLVLADYLGYPFDEGGKKPVAKTFADSLSKMIRPRRVEGGFIDARDIGSDYNNGGFADLPFMSTLFRAYQAFVYKGTVPNFKQLLDVSAKNLGLTSDSFAKNEYEKGIYNHPINGEVINKSMSPSYNPGTLDSEAVRSVLQSALKDSNGESGTNLRESVIKKLSDTEDSTMDNEELFNALREDKHFFSSTESKMFELNNVYNYLGGQIFYQMCKVLADMPAGDFLKVDIELNKKMDAEGLKKVTFSQKSTEVKPLAIAFAKYVPGYKDIFEQATALSKSNTPESNADVSDIAIPGIKKGSQAFPHQVDALGSLAKHPKFAILDIDPGGGKTITILADVMAIIGESSDRIKPLLIAPDGLAKNWANDLNKIAGDTWNVVPITNKIVGTKPGDWSFNEIDALFSKMPKNTIVVAGINFLKSKMFPIVIGNNVQSTSAPLELIKRHGFNYIALDESHKAKNPDTNVYKVLKSIMSSTSVKYIRLATGTLISNNLKDIVGQTSLYSSHVFRTPEEFEDDNTFIAEGSSAKQWFPDGPLRARKKLSRHASVITIKRKEWAFMLPTPVETFQAVSMVDDDTPASDLHMQMYNAVLDSELGKLQDIINKRPSSSGDDDDDESSGTEGIGGGLDLEGDESELASLGTMLTPFLARLERILTDPMGDVDNEGNKFGAAIFQKAGIENFVPRKVKAVIKKIDEHFNTPKWVEGKVYKELVTVEHKGKNYLLRKLTESPKRQDIPNAGAPDVDVDSWKHEPKGKVLVFCRYTRSVNAIYDGLPTQFKSIARRFTGDEGEAKWRNLEDFKGNDDVQILIANEQAITEGHNLQMASRLIRVESPWAPGELEQSQSRIFRPDPDAAKNFASTGKPGELYREVIYLDWIVSNDTLEVQKMGRLISKMIDKTKFDEIGNPRYKELEDKSLPPISMSLAMLQEKWSLDMLSGKTITGEEDPNMDYIPMYSLMQTIRANEFTSMRKTKKASMLNLKSTPMFDDAERLTTVPYLPDQDISDPKGYGLVGGSEFLANKDNLVYKITPDLFKGKPVHTSKGNGIIVSVLKTRSTSVDEFGNPIPNLDNPISSIRIRLKSTGKTINLKPSMIYIGKKVTEEGMSDFVYNSSPVEEDEEDEESIIEVKSLESAINSNKKRNDKKSSEIVKVVDRTRKRRRNVAAGKPANSGIDVAEVNSLPKVKKLKEPLTVAIPDKVIDLTISVYNGYLALFTDVEDPDSKSLRRLGFTEFGEYSYVVVKTKKQLYAVYDFLEDEDKEKDFELTDSHYVRPMNEISKSFESGSIGRAKFSPGLAPLNTLKNFFLLRKRLLKNKNILRVYPVVLEDSLMLCVDLFSNPSFRKYKNATIQGLGKNGKWKVSPGMMVFFSKNKTSIRSKIKDIIDAGFTIRNKAEVIEEFKHLKPRRAQIDRRSK